MPAEETGVKMRDLLRHSTAALRTPRLVALHLIVNAALLAAASSWLLIPDEHSWQLLFAGFSAALIVFIFLWLHSGTLAYASDPDPAKFRTAFAIRISCMAWMLLGLTILFWCRQNIDDWLYHWQIGGYLYSKVPPWLRPTGGEDRYDTAIGYASSILAWYVLPCVLLPFIAVRVAGVDTRRGLRTLFRWQYWLAMAATTLLGVWVTTEILGWVPGKTLSQQTTSLIIRLVVSYVIATVAWLATVGLLGYFVGSRDDGSSSSVTRKAAA